MWLHLALIVTGGLGLEAAAGKPGATDPSAKSRADVMRAETKPLSPDHPWVQRVRKISESCLDKAFTGSTVDVQVNNLYEGDNLAEAAFAKSSTGVTRFTDATLSTSRKAFDGVAAYWGSQSETELARERNRQSFRSLLERLKTQAGKQDALGKLCMAQCLVSNWVQYTNPWLLNRNDSVDGVICEASGNCYGYSNLMQHVLSEVGIDSSIYTNVTYEGPQPGDPSKNQVLGKHAIVQVRLGDETFLLEPNLGHCTLYETQFRKLETSRSLRTLRSTADLSRPFQDVTALLDEARLKRQPPPPQH
jgi:hypothetical protein